MMESGIEEPAYKTSSKKFPYTDDRQAAIMKDSSNTEAPKQLFPMGPTDANAADSFMKEKTLGPGEQMAKIIKNDKIYVLTLKEFSTSPIAVDRNAVEEEEPNKKTVRTNIYTNEGLAEFNKGLPKMRLENMQKMEKHLMSLPKVSTSGDTTAQTTTWKYPKTGQALVKVRGAIAKRIKNIEDERTRSRGGTRKRKMRSKKTLRHK